MTRFKTFLHVKMPFFADSKNSFLNKLDFPESHVSYINTSAVRFDWKFAKRSHSHLFHCIRCMCNVCPLLCVCSPGVHRGSSDFGVHLRWPHENQDVALHYLTLQRAHSSKHAGRSCESNKWTCFGLIHFCSFPLKQMNRFPDQIFWILVWFSYRYSTFALFIKPRLLSFML